MTTEKLLSRHPLNNGLTLEFWDLSRPMIGDRWIITLELRINIPINAANLPPDLLDQQADVVKALGPEITFSQRDERNFIDTREFEATLKEMEARFLALAPTYFGHPDFAGRLIRKRYAKFRERQRWYSTKIQ
ncbi:MAG: hypothetical protein M1438_04015 [Deltaproteobacteria bacterium]|nr:hypothetical protein [Deltaproteobacteria bacterium]